ncbi:MAG: hypothetical protein LQ341_003956 [Variospora aurantia]|nr:MAG: hypothetical protein LQ341_003956 [Variospora aurantia]
MSFVYPPPTRHSSQVQIPALPPHPFFFSPQLQALILLNHLVLSFFTSSPPSSSLPSTSSSTDAMAPVKKQFGWRSAARATERAQGKDARTAPAASAPQSVKERIEARNERTMALLGPKVAMALARRREADRVKRVRMEERMAEEARVAREALELEELLRLSVLLSIFQGPNSGVTPRAPKKVVHFAEEEEVLCEFEKYDHGEYEPERYDRAAADIKAGRRGPGVVNGYDLFYGSDCEISDDDDDDW